ncbi:MULTISPECIES: 2-dehydropantoate 2-reductase [unclassified Mesorhizobium]|uniref:2-dehydropantoate 2-reductase n=1 Tax=unclassified Mesorhizobium TaxID=325217 RepID=UPI00112E9A72|nr:MULTISPECIES: 2-dehydropantoate 2-reductase [unclassified Mesorhizobium]TPI18324.1 2-dehydropantoate 2-reductase [Mesorhizobium sp. B4-1-1]TPL46476.1 2-dehydropantoate 2-reductase [Mesorhizobium sp. B2-4-6]
MTRVCVFGAGAIGGYLAASLARAGADVSIVARGSHLAAIQANGLKLIKDGEETVWRVRASSDPRDLGEQDFVIVGMKAHAVPPVVGQFAPLLGKDTAVVPAVNGLPWWYFHGANTGTALDETWLESIDPGGAQWKGLGPERAIGCVVYPACDVPEPGVIHHSKGDRFTLGEPNGSDTERLRLLSELLIAGGLRAPRKARLRDEIWIKLWGNSSFNPVSALTGASLDVIGADPACRGLIHDIMVECKAIGEAIGARFGVAIEQRIKGGTDIVGHKPSTRHDVELGRPMEIDPLVSSVQELARRLSIPTPTLDIVAALLRLQGQVLGLYDRKPAIEDSIRAAG